MTKITYKRSTSLRERIGWKIDEFKSAFSAAWNDDSYSENMGDIIDTLAGICAAFLMLICIAYAYTHDFLTKNVLGRVSWTLAGGMAMGFATQHLFAVADLRAAGGANDGMLYLAWIYVAASFVVFIKSPLVRDEIVGYVDNRLAARGR